MLSLRLRRAACLCLTLTSSATALAWDDTRNISASSPRCAVGVSCATEVSPGFMSGQVYLNFSATAPSLAGAGFTLRVIDERGAVVAESSGGAMSDGSINALIASGQNLEPGRYRFMIDGVAEGSFTVTTGAGRSAQDRAASASPSVDSAERVAVDSDDVDANVDGADLAGTWHGIASTVGTIDLLAGGRYQYNGSAGGRYRVAGDTVRFDGALEAWNNGTATLRDGVLEFYWTNPDGSKNWFVFQR